jgi:hypothetical protein
MVWYSSMQYGMVWIGFKPTNKLKACIFYLFTLLYIKLLLWVLTTRWFYARKSKKDNIPVLNYQVG